MQCMQLPPTSMTCIVATAAQLQILKTGRLWWWGGRWIYQKCADTPDSDENHDHQNFHSDDEAGFVHTRENSWQTHLYLVCVGDTVCSGWKIANAVDTPISQVTSKTGQKKQTDDTLMCTQMMQIYVQCTLRTQMITQQCAQLEKKTALTSRFWTLIIRSLSLIWYL